MQVSKSYQGQVTLETAAVSRDYSYGYSGKISVYPSRVDTLNEIIATFLRVECGVNATYGYGPDSDDKFLWIYGVPFLFGMSGTANPVTFYQPFGSSGFTTSTYSTATTQPSISLFSGAAYNFGLVFSGNPTTGFCLRFKQYNATAVTSTLIVRFAKCENLINGANSVVWSCRNLYSTENNDTSPMLSGFSGVDVGANGIIKDSYVSSRMIYTDKLYTKAGHRTYNDGALPLVPLVIGPYRLNGIYLRPLGFGLPLAYTIASEVQPEVTIGGRSFLITCSDGVSTNGINMGLIETT